MIRAILFDIDGVLVDSVKANATMYRDVLGHFGFPGPTDAEQAAHNRRTFIDNIRIYAPGASDELVQKIFEYGVALTHNYDLLVLTDGVKETLEQLSTKYRLGVVSSRLHVGIRGMLEFFSVARYFTVFVGYEDTTEHKPHPDPLLFGAIQLKVEPNEVVYIGDALTDIEAAHAAGMKMVHYSTKTVSGDHLTVSNFSEIPDVIATL